MRKRVFELLLLVAIVAAIGIGAEFVSVGVVVFACVVVICGLAQDAVESRSQRSRLREKPSELPKSGRIQTQSLRQRAPSCFAKLTITCATALVVLGYRSP